MGSKTRIKLITRTIILVVTIVLVILDVDLVSKIMSLNIIGSIKFYQLLLAYLMYEMIIVLFPKYNKYSYSGKHFNRHYDEVENYKNDKLIKFTKKNNIRALRAAVFWITLNSIIGYIYIKLNLNAVYMYLLFLFYYWSDMFCVNVWCPFHKLIVKNKCCNECRIYNWGHLMYLTPLVFIPGWYTYSLVLVGIIVFLQWEYMNYKHPERFSPISNKTLRCSDCKTDCRYNKSKFKHKKDEKINKNPSNLKIG